MKNNQKTEMKTIEFFQFRFLKKCMFSRFFFFGFGFATSELNNAYEKRSKNWNENH